ncbi:unnamed protein product [Echinostoma caproni]|uniref:Gag-pol polyprotein n=1 Tax=Echinostoma caproni TaxID=27848 RepID=A0A183ANU0_9TREM|nr:unnamed protein product [Echinostoma caproni]
MLRKPRLGKEDSPPSRKDSEAQRRMVGLPERIPQPVERQTVTTAPKEVAFIEDLLEDDTWVNCNQPDDDLVGNNSKELRGMVLAEET